MIKPLEHIPTLADIQATFKEIQPLIHRTPVMTSNLLDRMAGAHLFFKCENFQKVGAFKMRGAASAAMRLTSEERARGLATHSSGNHGQAVARAAQLLGIPAYIVMPENAPKVKRQAAQSYGAKIISCAPTLASREAALEKVVAETGATFIHPFNDYNVIAGQATAALELMEDISGLDVVMAPVGGGGLMSGTTLMVKYLSSSVKAIGAEPKAVDDAYRSLQAGRLMSNDTTNTVADGLRTTLGEKTFEILSKELEEIITVEEEEIIRAMRLIWERMKIIIEASCAVPLAAVLKEKDRFKNQRIGIILTGGNVDFENLPF
jgi:threonine dehydratase